MGPLKRAFGRLRRSPLVWALAASLFVHVALGWYLASRPLLSRPPPPEASGQLIFEVVEAPGPPPASQRIAPLQQAPARAPRGPAAKSNPRQSPVQAGPSDSAEEKAGTPSADAPSAGPRLESLLPSDSLFGVPVPGSMLSGRTIRNDGSAPDAGAGAGAGKDMGERVQQQVTHLAQDLLATRRVESGAVDSYFHELREALEQNVTFQLPMKVELKKGLESAVQSYQQTLEAYGKSGDPGAMVSEADEDTLPKNGDPHGTGQVRRELMDHTARVNKLLEDAWGTDPVVVLELRQSHEGELLGARVLHSSGNEFFDDQVLALVPTGIARAPVVPEQVRARHPTEIRSVWQFRGHYVLRKKLKDMKVESPQDAAYLAAMAAASPFTGMPFEETTGEVYVLDLAHPEFHITPKLLRLY